MGHEVAISAMSQVTNGAEAIAFLAPMLPYDGPEERLVVIFLDEPGRVLGWFEQNGDRRGVDLPIRRIIAHALAHDATGMLMAHNHPSGDPTPSATDVEVTQRLAAAARPLGLTLRDHLIRAADQWRSLIALELL